MKQSKNIREGKTEQTEEIKKWFIKMYKFLKKRMKRKNCEMRERRKRQKAFIGEWGKIEITNGINK